MKKRFIKDEKGTTFLEFMITLPLVMLVVSFIYSIGVLGITAYITELATYDGTRTALALDKTAEDGEAKIAEAINLPILKQSDVHASCSKDSEYTSCTVDVKLDKMFNMIGAGREVRRTITLSSEKPVE